MKPTYKIMFDHREPSDAESARWQNFDQLIADYRAVRRHRQMGQRWLYGSLLVLGLGLISGGIGYWYYRSATSLPPPAPVSSVAPTLDSALPAIDRPTLSAVAPAIISPPPTAPDQPTTSSPQQETVADVGGLVEARPAGGYPALYDYFATQLEYPEAARRAGVVGSVLMEFTIDATGQPTRIRVVQGIREDLDQEAVRLIEEMPPWSPATVDSQPIATKHTMPLIFQLTNP